MKTVFVTGATEGQGHLLARKLGKIGWKVFAGVYPGAKTQGFPGLANVSTIDLDVTKTESVTSAAQTVTAALGGGGLDLVLNVAGIANIGVGVLEGANIDDMKAPVRREHLRPIARHPGFPAVAAQGAAAGTDRQLRVGCGAGQSAGRRRLQHEQTRRPWHDADAAQRTRLVRHSDHHHHAGRREDHDDGERPPDDQGHVGQDPSGGARDLRAFALRAHDASAAGYVGKARLHGRPTK